MDVIAAIEARFSVRRYRRDPVPEELLERVLEAARMAPSACNRQPFRIVVIRVPGREAELGRIYGRPWFVGAPLVIGMVAVPSEAWRRADGKLYADVDATIAMDHLILAAAGPRARHVLGGGVRPRRCARGAGPAGRRRAAGLHPPRLPCSERRREAASPSR